MLNSPYDPASTDASDRLAAARAAVEALPQARTQLLPAFLAAQHALGWLPRPAIEMVAAHLRVPVSEVYATATAYSELRFKPPVPGTWYICTGITCDLAGGRALLYAVGRTEEIDCQFLCALAPVVHDDQERLYGRVTPETLRARATP